MEAFQKYKFVEGKHSGNKIIEEGITQMKPECLFLTSLQVVQPMSPGQIIYDQLHGCKGKECMLNYCLKK